MARNKNIFLSNRINLPFKIGEITTLILEL